MMQGKITNLSSENSIVCQYMAELRDISIQGDRMRFRRNLERIAEVAGYEISKVLEWKEQRIQTPLATASVRVLAHQPLVCNILRAGLPMHQGLLNVFDKADNAFVSAYRKHDEKGKFIIELEYLSCPELEGRTLILADPMLATGSSMALTLKALFRLGHPAEIHVVTAIATTTGIEKVLDEIPTANIWAGDIDSELNDKAYIVPGLGDAGDLAFGSKIQN